MRNNVPPPRRTANGMPLVSHKFKVGQTVLYSPSVFEAAARKGSYKVMRLLPAEGSDYAYLVKSGLDGHERVVRESQLS